MQAFAMPESGVYKLKDFTIVKLQNLPSESYAKHRRLPQRYGVKRDARLHPILVVPRK